MNIAASDPPRLVAPRPLRIGSGQFTRPHPVRFLSPPSDHLDRLKISQSDQRDADDRPVGLYYDTSSVSDKDLASPRSSSCSGLPSEALEEFLSILRPTFHQTATASLRARLQSSTVSLPTISYEIPHSFKRTGCPEPIQTQSDSNINLSEQDPDLAQFVQLRRESPPDSPDSFSEPNAEFDPDMPPIRWWASCHHSSPISRMHTRNPFQRHPSYEATPPQIGFSPFSPSPAAIPLPLPTPDELIEVS